MRAAQKGRGLWSRRLTMLLGSLALGLVLSSQGQAASLKSLEINGQKVKVTDMRATPVDGIYRLRLDTGDVVFSDATGHYLLTGDMYENTSHGLVDVSEQQASKDRQAALAKVPSRDMVVFRPAGKVKGSVTIFADITCPYCRQLHSHIAELNQDGVEVRYMAFPRAGTDSPAAAELAQVFCSRNRQQSMTAAYQGSMPTNTGSQCADIISRDYELGRSLGVQGTPSIIFPDGSLVAGVMSVKQLEAELAQRS